ncbi:MAG TPA: DUF192 domain-containing protein [Casimicrobiaceae bacterium]|nr:DUF192 domain-containing protein [Casimicrobiaceae bacterium]
MNRLFALSFTLCALACSAVAQGAGAPGAEPTLRTIPLTVAGQKITVEVADTMDTRTRGLMHRFSLRQDHGMVFVFARPEPLGFWMRNTFIPLSIAFMDSTGQILNVDEMAPQSDATHWSRGPAMYALEMRKGWFKDHGIKAGDRVEGLPPAAKE